MIVNGINNHPEIVSDECFFEGTEKLLEIWFTSSHSDTADLRDVERSDWEELLKNVNCAILSTKRNSSTISYLLSESSLFIMKNQIILKTCGRTTLLEAVQPLLDLVKEVCGFDLVEDLFYSHKNYMRPDLQPLTYRHFDEEVASLDTIFDDGAAYALGRLNRDCWYLYTIDTEGVKQASQTLEILMTEMDLGIMRMFNKSHGLSAQELTKISGISEIFSNAIIDDWLFEPCGYSMNALLPNGGYATIHVTPEEGFSYVSFETNVPKDCYEDLMGKVLEIFKPNKVILTLVANEASVAAHANLQLSASVSRGYQLQDSQLCQMKNYKVGFSMYKRRDGRVAEPPV